jgi:hypothetical protein
VGFGAKYIKEAIEAARGFRSNMPDVPIALVTDEAVKPPEFDTVQYVPASQPRFSKRYWGFYNKIVGIKASPFRLSLYVDTDIVCCRPVHDIIVSAEQYGLVAVQAPRKVADFGVRKVADTAPKIMPEINTGVVAFDRHAIPANFFDAWLKLYEERVPTDESKNFGDQSVFRQLLTRLGINPFILPAEYNLRVGLPAVIHGAVRLLHGRPAAGCDVVERFINCSSAQRIYIPSTALIVMDETTGEWEVRKFPDASIVRRMSYLDFAKGLLAI